MKKMLLLGIYACINLCSCCIHSECVHLKPQLLFTGACWSITWWRMELRGNLIHVCKYLKAGCIKEETGLFWLDSQTASPPHWWPVTGSETMGTNWNIEGSLLTSGSTFSLWGWLSTGTECPERLQSLPLWRYSKATGTQSWTSWFIYVSQPEQAG